MVFDIQPVPSLQSLEGPPIHRNRLLPPPPPPARGAAGGCAGLRGGYGPGFGVSEVAATLGF